MGEPRCKKCSKPINNMEKELCFDCSTRNFHFVAGYALWVYDSQMRKSIAAFKYNNKREYASFYIEELRNHYKKTIMDIRPDAFVPIPLHKSKLRLRGFNQAEIIARGMGKELRILVIPNMLCRVRNTLPQKELDDRGRLKNLSNAFTISDKYKDSGIELKKIMLIDDIYTTGSTIEACTNILLKYGVEEVYFLSLCIGKGY